MPGHSVPTIHIGTSGWVYPHWRSRFYPRGVPEREWLGFYASHLDTVEVNFTFYRLPRRDRFEAWHGGVPDGFRFAVKGSRYITHIRRLRDVKAPVAKFVERARGLQGSLGPILWQLPPDLRCDQALLDDFLETLPKAERHTIEFRHPSWRRDSVLDALRQRDIALCIAHRAGRRTFVATTAGFVYLRFHTGSRSGHYTPDTLRRWARRIREWRDAGLDVWAYFNNDQEGYAPVDARSLRRMVQGKTRPRQ